MTDSTDTRINLKLPASWEDLTDDQLRMVYRCVASGMTNFEMKLHCSLRFSGLRPKGGNLFRLGDQYVEVSNEELLSLARSLDFIDELPARPVRPCLRHRRALPAMLDGVDFETFLVLDNYLQGYLATDDLSLLKSMADILYPASGLMRRLPVVFRDSPDVLTEREVAALYWMTSLKNALARLYPHFLQLKVSANTGTVPQMRLVTHADGVDAQLRALTKGDITKEGAVRRMPYRRALTELNALAREAEELRRKLKK